MKKALMEFLKDEGIQSLLREQAKMAAAEMMAAKDSEIAELKEELRRTNERLNELEQYSRRLCVNVSGIPETAGESTDQIVTDLASMTGVTITPADIDRSHRIGKPTDGKSRPIIVRFANFSKRQEFYNARRELRKPRPVPGSTVTAETASRTFLADNLTKQNQHTMFVARGLKKEGKIHSTWTDVGKMKIRLREGGPTTIIRSVEDLYAAVDPDRRPGAASAAPAAADREGYRTVPARKGKRGTKAVQEPRPGA